MKKGLTLFVLFAVVLILTGCDMVQSDTEAISDSEGIDVSELFTKRDMEIGYDEENSVFIELAATGTSCDSDAVEISESTITIRQEGTYILTGELEDGSILVDAEKTDKVQLVLDGVDITSVTSAPIYIRSADKVFITTTSSSENTLTNGGEYDAIDENHIDAVIFSKSDLTLNGAGILKIRAAAGHGIVSKDDLVMTSGTYDIVAQSHGISGKDSVRIANGAYVIEAGKDGIHAENNDDADLGFLYIADGTFQIEADGDGMSAATYLQIDDGFYEIETGGGSLEASEKEEVREFGPGQANHQEETTEQDTVSTKGLKGSKDLTILGGDFVIDSLDDSLHSNGSLSIQGGILELSTGDDGIHADEQVSILDGEIQINNSYEGIEGLCIDIEGGDITLTASDDGLNAAGGNDESGFMGPGGDIFAETEGAYIHISGGTIQIDVAGDGIDSNGDFYVSGGTTYVTGPTDGGNGALDYNGDASISGGTFVAVGASQMAENFKDTSTQGVIMKNVDSVPAGSQITLSDNSGNLLISWKPEKEYASVIISCPDIKQGETYVLDIDQESFTITMDSLVYGSGGFNGKDGTKGPMDQGGEKPVGPGRKMKTD